MCVYFKQLMQQNRLGVSPFLNNIVAQTAWILQLLWVPPFCGPFFYWRAQHCIIQHHIVCSDLIAPTTSWRHISLNSRLLAKFSNSKLFHIFTCGRKPKQYFRWAVNVRKTYSSRTEKWGVCAVVSVINYWRLLVSSNEYSRSKL